MDHYPSLGQAALALKALGKKIDKNADVFDNLPGQSLYNPKNFEVEDERHNRLKACGMIDTDTTEPRFDSITKLMAEVFSTPVCLLTLITDDRVWFKSKVGPFGSCVCRDGSWCNYIVVPTEPEVLITEDASVDARFSHNPYVAGDPYIKFYAGAPLVGVGGFRYGTLCVVDLKPRAFTAEMYAMLNNFAELAVQELEADAALLADWSATALENLKKNRHIQARLSTAIDGVAMLDTRKPEWNFMYSNPKFESSTQSESGKSIGLSFWELFEPVTMQQDDMVKATAFGSTMHVVIKNKLTRNYHKIQLRPASSDQLTPGKAIGVPSWVPSENELDAEMGIDMDPHKVKDKDLTMCADVEKCFYFVVIVPFDASPETSERPSFESLAASTTTKSSENLPSSEDKAISGGESASTDSIFRSAGSSKSSYGDYVTPPEMLGLKMGPIIGRGGFGKVYRGKWEGETVAVKVVEPCKNADIDQVRTEGALSMSLNHPNIVKTLHFATTYDYGFTFCGLQLKKEETPVVWMLQQFCNRGTLIDAAERGWLKEQRSIFGKPDMVTIYLTLIEVAEALAYIHSHNIVHRDLNGRNVMLKKSDKDKRGFVAKLADFGLASICYGESVSPDNHGTISHMSPELLGEGIMSTMADIWAFGVMMWEIYTGYRAYQDKVHGHTMFLITSGKGRLEMPEDCPKHMTDIFDACMQREPAARPSADKLTEMLRNALKAAEVDEM